MEELEDWAKHLVNRFGKEKMKKFAASKINCPCSFLERHCPNCKHLDKPLIHKLNLSCYEAIKWWMSLDIARIIAIKKRITLL